jgi:hypothetical protein
VIAVNDAKVNHCDYSSESSGMTAESIHADNGMLMY